MKPYVFPYKMSSESGKALAQALGAKRVRANGNYRQLGDHLVINWGNSVLAPWMCWESGGFTHTWQVGILNRPVNVAAACNKLHTFDVLSSHNIPCVEHTTDIREAYLWLQSGQKVYARSLLSSHSGKGIIIVQDGDPIPQVPLYTKHFKHKHEYRVHVFNGKVIDVQLKRRRRGAESFSGIRNLANGWVYTREDINVPQNVLDVSIAAIDTLGLDFGAADVAYNEHYDSARILEVNTAPGLSGTTLINYANAIKEML